MAMRGADFDPNAPCGDHAKMEHKEQDALKQSSMEREAELKQKIKEAKMAAEFYKLKSENIREEIEELEQREEDLCNQIRKADADADNYRSEAEIFESDFKVVLNFDDWMRMFVRVEAEFPHQDEILCGSDDDGGGGVGYPTDAYYGCPGDEGECDHDFLPPNYSFGSYSNVSPIVSPSTRRLRSLLSISLAMQELPLPTDTRSCTAAADEKRRKKLQAKQLMSSVKTEAELEQELEEANREVGFYKDKCDFGRYELDECKQRGTDLLQRLSEAKIRAEQYKQESNLLGEYFQHAYHMGVHGMALVTGSESVPEEIVCCSEVCRCCRDEEACMVALPCNCLSMCIMCEMETDTCPNCGSVKTGCLWTEVQAK